MVQAATKFKGPDVLAALRPEVGTGASAQRRLAAFGTSAIDGLLQVYAEPKGSAQPEVIRFAVLKTLAAIALGTELSPKDRMRLEERAKRSLSASEASEVAGAMYLAASLRNPALVSVIRSLQVSGFRGFSDQEVRWLESVSKKALDAASVR